MQGAEVTVHIHFIRSVARLSVNSKEQKNPFKRSLRFLLQKFINYSTIKAEHIFDHGKLMRMKERM